MERSIRSAVSSCPPKPARKGGHLFLFFCYQLSQAGILLRSTFTDALFHNMPLSGPNGIVEQFQRLRQGIQIECERGARNAPQSSREYETRDSPSSIELPNRCSQLGHLRWHDITQAQYDDCKQKCQERYFRDVEPDPPPQGFRQPPLDSSLVNILEPSPNVYQIHPTTPPFTLVVDDV